MESQDHNRRYEAALAFYQAQRLDLAERTCQEILNSDPEHVPALKLMSLTLYAAKRHVAAIPFLRRIFLLTPDNAEICRNLAVALVRGGELAEADLMFQKALSCQPGAQNTLLDLAHCRYKQGRINSAHSVLAQLLQLAPDHAKAWEMRGNLFFSQNRIQKAVNCFEQVLAHQPDYPKIHAFLAQGYSLLQNLEKAVYHYQQAIAAHPEDPLQYYTLARVLLQQCETEQALPYLKTAVELNPENQGWAFFMETLCPAIPQDIAENQAVRQRIGEAITRFSKIDFQLPLADINRMDCCPSFYLPYHGENERELRQQFGQLFANSLQDSAPRHPDTPYPPGKRPYQIGFLVSYRHEGVFCKLVGGILDHLCRETFNIVIYAHANGIPVIQSRLNNLAGITFVPTAETVEECVAQISAVPVELLYYFEVGTDSVNYFLPFFQLAPVQCTSWGYPVTTGIPTIQYFISSHLLEDEQAQEHYSEALVLMDTLPAYYYKPQLPAKLKSRQDFGLSEQQHLYLCPQNIFKFHPDMDKLFADILAEDPEGVLVLIKDKGEYQYKLLLERMRPLIPDLDTRIIGLPKQTHDDFLSLLALSDVLLDTLHFGSGMTAYEGLAFGIPIVTLPMPYMRSCVTQACYKKMGMLECIATSLADYVRLAVRLGTDAPYRRSLSAKIVATHHVLFEDRQAVQEMEEFFIHAIDRARTESPPLLNAKEILHA